MIKWISLSYLLHDFLCVFLVGRSALYWSFGLREEVGNRMFCVRLFLHFIKNLWQSLDKGPKNPNSRRSYIRVAINQCTYKTNKIYLVLLHFDKTFQEKCRNDFDNKENKFKKPFFRLPQRWSHPLHRPHRRPTPLDTGNETNRSLALGHVIFKSPNFKCSGVK